MAEAGSRKELAPQPANSAAEEDTQDYNACVLEGCSSEEETQDYNSLAVCETPDCGHGERTERSPLIPLPMLPISCSKLRPRNLLRAFDKCAQEYERGGSTIENGEEDSEMLSEDSAEKEAETKEVSEEGEEEEMEVDEEEMEVDEEEEGQKEEKAQEEEEVEAKVHRAGELGENVPVFQQPAEGDRVLVLQAHWLGLILDGQKTLEVRGTRLHIGQTYYLGCRSQIHGSAKIAAVVHMRCLAEFQALASKHKLEDVLKLPYKNTYVNELVDVAAATTPVPYHHPRGAVGMVIFHVMGQAGQQPPCRESSVAVGPVHAPSRSLGASKRLASSKRPETTETGSMMTDRPEPQIVDSSSEEGAHEDTKSEDGGEHGKKVVKRHRFC